MPCMTRPELAGNLHELMKLLSSCPKNRTFVDLYQSGAARSSLERQLWLILLILVLLVLKVYFLTRHYHFLDHFEILYVSRPTRTLQFFCNISGNRATKKIQFLPHFTLVFTCTYSLFNIVNNTRTDMRLFKSPSSFSGYVINTNKFINWQSTQYTYESFRHI